jgi:hypothetical protein
MGAMTGDFSHIACCADLHEDDASLAIRSRHTARALLEHLATIALSVEDAALVLRVLALLATEDAAEWVDGRLEVELVGHGTGTSVEIVTSIGGGLRERLLPRLTLRAAMAELVAAVERAPVSIEPLFVWHGSGGRVKLVPDATAPRSVRPRPPIAIAGDSLVESVPPLPPGHALHEEEAVASPEKAPRGLGDLDDPLTDLDQGWGG